MATSSNYFYFWVYRRRCKSFSAFLIGFITMQVISIQNIQDRPIIDAIAPQDFLLIGDASDGNQVKRVLVSTLTSYLLALIPVGPVDPQPTQSQSIFAADVVPDDADVFASQGRTFGTRFKTTKSGSITAIRFYKDANETGAQIGGIWSDGGNLLASVNFPEGLQSGWQTQNLSSPIAISADTFYLVEVSTNSKYGRKWYTETPEIISGDLIAEARGFYGWAENFPVQQEAGIRNYLRDVVFEASP